MANTGEWLARHGLDGSAPTPLLDARLAARRRMRRADSIVFAVVLIVAALVQAYDRIAVADDGGLAPHRRISLVILVVLMAALLALQSLFDHWVRRVDREAGAALAQRAAHLTPPGWRALLGVPHAAFMAIAFAATAVLAAGALTSGDSMVRYAGLIVLILLIGVTAGIAVQLRDLLRRPVVAEDEASLTADVVMRVEDARELTSLWSVPLILLFAATPGWWNIASFVLAAAGSIGLVIVHRRTPSIPAQARRAMA